MAVKHAAHKKKVLGEIQKLMDKVSGHRLHGDEGALSGEESEPEETDDAPADQEPTRPKFTWTEGGEEDGEGAGDEEDAPSDDELDRMAAEHAKLGARLAKHRRK